MAYSVLSSNSQRAGRVNVLRDAMAVDTLDAGGVYLGTTGGQVYGSADAASTRRQSAGGGMRVLAHLSLVSGFRAGVSIF